MGTPPVVTSKFLHSLREENLITHGRPELNVDVQYPHLKAQHLDSVHQFPILRSKADLSCPLPIPPKQLGNGSGFRDHLQNLGVPPSSNVFFYLFTFTRPSGGGLTTGGCLFEPMSIERFSSYVKSHFTTSNLYISRCLGLREQFIFGKLKSGNSLRLMFIGTRTLKLPG